jgi:hypothetical protein
VIWPTFAVSANIKIPEAYVTMEHNSKRIIVQATQFPFDIDYLVSLSWRCGSWEAERLPLLLPGLLQSKMEFRF